MGRVNKLHYAVVVGIDHYPAINTLKYARRDAKGFYDWLVDPDGGGVPEKNATLITAQPSRNGRKLKPEEARPIKQEIDQEINKFRQHCMAHVAKHAEDWDKTRLYFFASGHGIAPEPDEAALLMAAAGPGNYTLNFSCAQYMKRFQKEQVFRELVFFADCCRERADNAALYGPNWDETPRQNGLVLTLRGYATIFGELAFEPLARQQDPDKLRGYFTQALLEGLRDHKAVNPATGVIDSGSLSDFVYERVRTLTSTFPKPQTPTMTPDPGNPRIVFKQKVSVEGVEKAVHQKYKVKLVLPAGFQGSVQLLGGMGAVIATSQVTDQVLNLKLEKGIYQIQLPDGTSPFKNGGYFSVNGENTYEL